MTIKRLGINNFRGIPKIDLEFNKGVNVIAGINGVGKSAILDAVYVLLDQYSAFLHFGWRPERGVAEDVRIGQKGFILEVEVELLLHGSITPTFWTISLWPQGDKGDWNDVEPSRFQLSEALKNPVLVIQYDARRSAIDTSATQNETALPEPFGGAFTNAVRENSDFKHFFRWFKQEEDLEGEILRDQPEFQTPALSAVRTAIERFTGFTGLRVRRSGQTRMTVKKSGVELNISQLSDGERNLLAMVGDIARRLALLNPNINSDAILSSPGIILVDEIELHLHPRWQRDLLPKLEQTFPNCQFIVTTHSPQILSHVEESKVWIIHDSGDYGIGATRPRATFGMDSNRILEEEMGVPERPKEVKALIEELFALLSSNDIKNAQLKLEALTNLYPDLPEVTQARSLLKRKEIIGR